MATLTFADEPADLDEGWRAVESFRRRLVAAGFAAPAIVPEFGEANGRLHFHAAMPDYVPKDRLAALWGHGFVDIRKLRPRKLSRAGQMGGRAQARLVAGYVAGYIAKSGQGSPPGGASGSGDPAGGPVVGTNRRRYSIPKSSSPSPVRFSCWSLFEAWSEIQSQCGHNLSQVWASPLDDAEWRGPPTLLLMG